MKRRIHKFLLAWTALVALPLLIGSLPSVAQAQGQPQYFTLEMVLQPEQGSELLSLSPIVIILQVPYEEGELGGGAAIVSSHKILWEADILIDTQGRFLGFDSGELGGEFTGTYLHEAGIYYYNGLIEGSLSKCYETRDYLRRTFNDPTYPFDCSEQERRMETEYVNDMLVETNLTGSWFGLINSDDGTGSGEWQITVEGVSLSNGYVFNTTTYSGDLTLTPISFEEAAVRILFPEGEEPPIESGEPPAEEWDDEPIPGGGYDEPENMPDPIPAGQSAMMWGSAAVSILVGGWVTILLMEQFAPTEISYFPVERPDPGNVEFPQDGGGVRAVGAVGGFMNGPSAAVTPPGVGQKIGSRYTPSKVKPEDLPNAALADAPETLGENPLEDISEPPETLGGPRPPKKPENPFEGMTEEEIEKMVSDAFRNDWSLPGEL